MSEALHNILMFDPNCTNTHNPCGMERKVEIYKSFVEAKQADKKYYHSLTPAQRIDIVLRLQKLHYGDELTNKFVRVLSIVKLSDLK